VVLVTGGDDGEAVADLDGPSIGTEQRGLTDCGEPA
jgi:hypothetical protein